MCVRTCVRCFIRHPPPSPGLPTDSLALDEANVYWRGDNIVAYASRDPPSTPTVFSTASVSVVSSLSPGQEPLPRE